MPPAITDSAEAVWTVTPPEEASEVDTKFPRSQMEGEGETPVRPPGEWALGREAGSKVDGSATAWYLRLSSKARTTVEEHSMPRTPKDIADHLVQMYGTSTKGLLMPREEFEQHAERPNVDHRLIRSIDLELRPMGYILSDLLQERQCVVLMSISTIMEALGQGEVEEEGERLHT